MGSNKSNVSSTRKIEIVLELILCQIVIVFGLYFIYLEIMFFWFNDHLMSGNFINLFEYFGIDMFDPLGLKK